jgi:hypothetical protein
MERADLFASHPELLAGAAYNIKSNVPMDIVADFVKLIQGQPVQFTAKNSPGLETLGEEFGFKEVLEKASAFTGGNNTAKEELRQWKEYFSQRLERVETENGILRNELAAVNKGIIELKELIAKMQTSVQQLKADSPDSADFENLKLMIEKIEGPNAASSSSPYQANKSRPSYATSGSSLPRIESGPGATPGLLPPVALGGTTGVKIAGVFGKPPSLQPMSETRQSIGMSLAPLTPSYGYDLDPVLHPPNLSGEVNLLYFAGGELNGIIAYLTKKCGGNVCDKGIIEVIATVVKEQSPDSAKNVVDLDAMSGYCSLNSPNQCLTYNFKEMRIRPTHYTLRSNWNGKAGGNNPKSWVIEASMDGIMWVEVDRKENNHDLDGKDVRRTYRCVSSPLCKYFRLRQTRKNHAGKDWLILSGMEVFGTLIE